MPSNVRLYETNGEEFNEVLYPETTVGQVKGLLDSTGKVDLKWMSQAVLGGAKSLGGVTTATTQAYNLFGQIVKRAVELGLKVKPDVDFNSAHQSLIDVLAGRYFVVQNVASTLLDLTSLSNVSTNTYKDYFKTFYGITSDTLPYTVSFTFDGDDGLTGTEASRTLENGDFIMFNGITYDLPTIDTTALKALLKLYNAAGTGEFKVGSNNVTSVSITFNGLSYANKLTYKLIYSSISVHIEGTIVGAPPEGLVRMTLGDADITKAGDVTLVGEPGNQTWELDVNFFDVEATFTQTDWNTFYSDDEGNNIVVHFGVINNTYGDATTDIKGIIARATDAEAIDTSNNIKAMTPKTTKLAIDQFGLKLATGTVLEMVSNTTNATSPKQVKDIVSFFGGMKSFDSLAQANNHESKFVAGTVVAVKV